MPTHLRALATLLIFLGIGEPTCLGGNLPFTTAMAVGPDGSIAAIAQDSDKPSAIRILIVSLANGRLKHVFEDDRMESAVAISPDGKELAIGVAKTPPIRLIRLADYQDLPALDGENEQGGGPDEVRTVIYSPDGKYLLSDDGYTVTMWELGSRRIVLYETADTLRFHDGLRGLAMSSDNRVIVAFDNRNLYRFDSQKGTHSTEEESWSELALRPDGRALAVVDQNFNLVIRSTETKKVSKTLPHTAVNLIYSPDGKKLLLSGYSLVLYDPETDKKEIIDHAQDFKFAQFTQNGKYVVALVQYEKEDLAGHGKYQIGIWDAETGKRVRIFPIPTPPDQPPKKTAQKSPPSSAKPKAAAR